MDRNLLSAQPVGLRHWLLIALLLFVTLQVGSLFPSAGGQVQAPVAQVAATVQSPPVVPGDTVISPVRTISLEEIPAAEGMPAPKGMPTPEGMPAAIHAAELLVVDLWQATPNAEAPIESLQWLAAYFGQGWAPEIAMELATYYSYFDGTHYYLRATDDIMPPLFLATTVTVKRVDERAVVVEAEFPALDGPVQYPALSRSYSLIKEDGTWKIERISLGSAHPPDTRLGRAQTAA